MGKGIGEQPGLQSAHFPRGRILPGLQSFHEFQEDNSDIFPSLDSLRWFTRVNRSELIDAEAIAIIAGRTFIDRDRFAPIVLKHGKEQARRR